MGHRFEAGKKEVLVDRDRQWRQPAGTILDRAKVAQGETWGDLGCGVGYFTLPLAARGASVIAVDAQEEMLRSLGQRLYPEIRARVFPVLSEMPPIAMRDGCLDRSIMVNVLHEVDDRDSLSREVSRVLRPGGRLTLVDFPRKQTPFGPPLSERIAPEEAIDIFRRMRVESRWDLCNYYQLELRKD
ncbi:MAG: class I SAM-dependent methyltransferase [Methanomassiliicoccales archaeon]